MLEGGRARFNIVDSHEAESVRPVRGPIVIRSEANLAVVVSLLMIGPERLASRFCRAFVKPTPVEQLPSTFNSLHCCTCPLVRDDLNVKARLSETAFVSSLNDLIVLCPIVG
jgi:hypothetical protein